MVQRVWRNWPCEEPRLAAEMSTPPAWEGGKLLPGSPTSRSTTSLTQRCWWIAGQAWKGVLTLAKPHSLGGGRGDFSHLREAAV